MRLDISQKVFFVSGKASEKARIEAVVDSMCEDLFADAVEESETATDYYIASGYSDFHTVADIRAAYRDAKKVIKSVA